VDYTADWFEALIRGRSRGLVPSLLRAGLWWSRCPYAMTVLVRNSLYDLGRFSIVHAEVPVISVGNLTLGGTGKTPCVEYIARYFRASATIVVILSRGVGVEHGPNDEALVLEENLPDVPHLQGRDRAVLAKLAVEELEAELLILDDGFQHRRLARDLDIVLLDATQPITEEYLFPRGLLREGIGGLRRAQVVLWTRCDQVAPEKLLRQRHWLSNRFPQLLQATTRHAAIGWIEEGEETEEQSWQNDLSWLKGRSVAAFCGIGHPAAFARTLKDLGVNLIAFRSFPDHYAYTRDDVRELHGWAEHFSPETIIATSQKDFVKLRLADLGARRFGAVRVGLQFLEGEAEFQQRLSSVLAKSAG